MDTQDPLNLPESEFDAVMTEIDATLCSQSDSVAGRELMMMAEFTRRFSLSISNTHPTTKRIFDWCDRMYGDRLRVDFDRGCSIVLIKGDLCRLRNILFYGAAFIVCTPNPVAPKTMHKTPNGSMPVYNLLDWIPGLTPTLAARVSTEECKEILTVFKLMSTAFSGLDEGLAIRGQANSPFIKEAIDDDCAPDVVEGW